MESKSINRKLAAILFCDIAGYTSMMQSDEVTTRQALQKFRDTLNEKVQSYQGRIVNFYGDGCLCIFDSSVNAMQCAREVQAVFQSEPKVPVRIGLHSGDVFFEADNVYGDGVNIASRIESLGVAGSILFSKRMKRDNRNQPDLQIQPLGSFEFKNVDKEMEVFALANEGLVVPRKEELKGKLKTQRSPLQKYGWMALLVLVFVAGAYYLSDSKKAPGVPTNDLNAMTIFPFDVRGSADIQYLGEGMVDLISTKLDGIPGINPIDPNMVFSRLKKEKTAAPALDEAIHLSENFGSSRFILGTIVELNDQLQITATKYNAQGQLLGKQNVEGNKSELSTLIDQLAKSLIAEEIEKEGQELKSLALLTSNNLPALQAFLLGERQFRNGNLKQSYQHFVEAIELDSTFAMAWMRLGRVGGWDPTTRYPGAWDQVRKYENKLPVKWQEFQQVKRKFSSGNPGIVAATQRLIQKYGETPEFTNHIAEHLFHYNPSYGKSIIEAKPWLQKTRALDPHNMETFFHLMHIAVSEGDTTTLKQILSETDPTSEWWPIMKSVVLRMRGTINDAEILELANHPKFRSFYLGVFLVSPEDALHFMKPIETLFPFLDENYKNAYQRVIYGLQGKEKAAFQVGNAANPGKFMLALPAYLMANRDYRPMSEAYENYFQALKGKEEPWALFCSMKYAWALDKNREVESLKSQLLANSKTEKGFVAPAKFFYYSFLAFEARMTQKNEEALSWIDSSYQYTPGSWFEHTAYLDKLIMLADLYEEKGEYEKSIAYLENMPLLHASGLTNGYKNYRLSQLYELNGQDNKAIVKCDLLLKDYQNCDAKYRPWVEEARQRRERLMAKQL